MQATMKVQKAIDMGATAKPEMMSTVKLAPKLAETWRCPVCTFTCSTMFDKECTMCFYPRTDADMAIAATALDNEEEGNRDGEQGEI